VLAVYYDKPMLAVGASLYGPYGRVYGAQLPAVRSGDAGRLRWSGGARVSSAGGLKVPGGRLASVGGARVNPGNKKATDEKLNTANGDLRSADRP